jgi:hypothetical protein
MKRIITVILFLGIFKYSYSQENTPSHAELFAERIAQRMVDSVGVNAEARKKILEVNTKINKQKAEVWASYKGDMPSIQRHLQEIENSRDLLYRNILTESEFKIYRQRKKNIISN